MWRRTLPGSWIALFVALWVVVLFLLVLVLGLSRRIGILEAELGNGPCVTLGEKLKVSAEDSDGLPESLRNIEILIVTDGAGESIFGNLGISARLVTQSDAEISRELGIRVSPFGLGIDPEAIVRAVTLPNSVEDVAGMAEACRLADTVQTGA
jgi:hypothetical protein